MVAILLLQEEELTNIYLVICQISLEEVIRRNKWERTKTNLKVQDIETNPQELGQTNLTVQLIGMVHRIDYTLLLEELEIALEPVLEGRVSIE